MNDSALHRLAERAGVLVHWHDYRGRPKVVSPEVLAQVLATLELPAGDDAAVQASLDQLDHAALHDVPAMITVKIDDAVRLPQAMRGLSSVTLSLEFGGTRELPVHRDERGPWLDPIAEPGYHGLHGGVWSLQLAVAPRRAYTLADAVGERRTWGLATQAYSLRRIGDGGVGDFTALADAARAAAAHGADLLTVSPLHALFAGDVHRFGPYAPSSRLFINAMHVDPAAVLGGAVVTNKLEELGLTARWEALERLPQIDWPEAQRVRLALLRGLWDDWSETLQSDEDGLAHEFENFRSLGGAALEAHARFEALHSRIFADDPTRWNWRDWPAEYRDPHSPAVARFAAEHAHEVGFHVFLQWLADQGCATAHTAARNAGMAIGLVSDLAVGADSGGSMAWSNQQDMLVGLSVGAPPDLLNTLGQNWGLTTFSPRALSRNAFAPFLAMLRAALRNAGGVRIDHILGLGRLWLIPEGQSGGGAYVRYPIQDFYNLIALESWRHRAIIIGEDLGTVPDDFRGPLAEAGILGMRVLWFERDHGLYVEPARWDRRALAMTTTHDLPTVAGWWRGHDIVWRTRLNQRGPDFDEAGEAAERVTDRQKMWDAFLHAGCAQGPKPADDDPQPAVDAAVEFVGKTACPLAILPLEDIVGIEEQPNFPGTTEVHPNWQQRFDAPIEALLVRPRSQDRLARLRKVRS